VSRRTCTTRVRTLYLPTVHARGGLRPLERAWQRMGRTGNIYFGAVRADEREVDPLVLLLPARRPRSEAPAASTPRRRRRAAPACWCTAWAHAATRQCRSSRAPASHMRQDSGRAGGPDVKATGRGAALRPVARAARTVPLKSFMRSVARLQAFSTYCGRFSWPPPPPNSRMSSCVRTHQDHLSSCGDIRRARLARAATGGCMRSHAWTVHRLVGARTGCAGHQTCRTPPLTRQPPARRSQRLRWAPARRTAASVCASSATQCKDPVLV